MTDRVDWTVLGRIIGSASGWDQADTFVMNIYDFEPAANVPLEATECLFIDFENGKVEAYNDDTGKPSWSKDLIESLSGATKT